MSESGDSQSDSYGTIHAGSNINNLNIAPSADLNSPTSVLNSSFVPPTPQEEYSEEETSSSGAIGLGGSSDGRSTEDEASPSPVHVGQVSHPCKLGHSSLILGGLQQ
jgi:hypothetical protein